MMFSEAVEGTCAESQGNAHNQYSSIILSALHWPSLVRRLSPHVNEKSILQAAESWVGPGNEANTVPADFT